MILEENSANPSTRKEFSRRNRKSWKIIVVLSLISPLFLLSVVNGLLLATVTKFLCRL